jgi:hypothetical protein
VPPSLMGDPGRIRQVSQVSSFLDLTCWEIL